MSIINTHSENESDYDNNINNKYNRYINCWACHVTLEIPIVQGQYAEKFTVTQTITYPYSLTINKLVHYSVVYAVH